MNPVPYLTFHCRVAMLSGQVAVVFVAVQLRVFLMQVVVRLPMAVDLQWVHEALVAPLVLCSTCSVN